MQTTRELREFAIMNIYYYMRVPSHDATKNSLGRFPVSWYESADLADTTPTLAVCCPSLLDMDT